MNNRIILTAAALTTAVLCASAQNSQYTLDLNVEKQGIDVSPTLNGIFYEDINQSNDGGISAQLIQNNSFQMFKVEGAQEKEFSTSPEVIFGWSTVSRGGAKGQAITVDNKPLVKLHRYYDFDTNDKYDDELKYQQYCVQIEIKSAGSGFGLAANGFGIAPQGRENEGYYYSNNTQKPSIAAVAGVKYNLGIYLQGSNYKGTVKVYLENAAGEKNSNTIKIKGLKGEWKRYSGSLKALSSDDSRLVVEGDSEGTFYMDFVTLVPEAKELWHNGKAGDLRKDLMESLEALHPTFMRFPGGCASEGSNYWGQVFWKNTIGPVEERIGIRNHWGTWTSQHIGFYEYLLMAEELGATPLPVLNNGVTCQFAGHSYIAPLETEADRERFYNIYVKDALDLIEFCNGDGNTEWGAKRIAFGHSKPFNLKYLGIGNENSGEEFWERFDIIYKAVKEKYPEIVVITTSGASASGREFDTNYSIIDKKYPESIVDEHYYMSDEWFYTNGHRYDSDQVRGSEGVRYDRNKPARVFIGEFANSRANNAYSSAMSEAAYFTSVERNSDMVVMAAYAPLLCKKGFGKWGSNLIWFDNRGLWHSTNYYYQYLFANNTGNKTIESSPMMNGSQTDEKVYTSSTIDTRTGVVYLKVVNAEPKAKPTTLRIGSDKRYRATLQYISSEDVTVKNQGDNNYYWGAEGVKDFSYNEKVKPQSIDLGTVSEALNLTIPLNSIGVIKLVPVR